MASAGRRCRGITAMAEIEGNGAEPQLGDAELRGLSAAFSPGRTLRGVGLTAWLLVGCFALLFGLVWPLGTTMTIVGPVTVAAVAACVAAPVVGWRKQHRVPRAAGAAIVLLAMIALGGVIVVLVIGGITSQSDEIGTAATNGADRIANWLKDLGVNADGVASAKAQLTSTM